MAWIERYTVLKKGTYIKPFCTSILCFTSARLACNLLYFFLGQRKIPYTDLWPVGESAKVETVQVGDVTGEYVVGAWGGAEDHQVWENNPAFQHLRWQANGYYFNLDFTIMGVQEADYADCPYYISKEQLIDIARSMK